MRFGLHDGYWGSISAIIVLQSNVGATVTASRDRLLGTFMGAAFGFAFSVFGAPPWNYILAVLLAIIVCGLLGLRNSSRLAAVTITIIMLVPKSGPRWELALDRVGEVLLGIVVALAVTTLVFPDRARLGCATAWRRNFFCSAASSRRFSRDFAAHRRKIFPPCAKIRWLCCAATASFLKPRAMSRAAPAGAKGLSMLSQFGRSLLTRSSHSRSQ